MSLKEKIKERTDSWANALTSLAKRGKDKSVHNTFEPMEPLDYEIIGNLYDGDGLAADIIDFPVEDMLRAGWKIEGDEKDRLANEHKRIGLMTVLQEGFKAQDTFGGALIVAVTDKSPLEKPFVVNSKIEELRVYPASRITTDQSSIVTDSTSPFFDDFEYFTVRLLSGNEIRVHASRCIPLKGIKVASEENIEFRYRYWGISVLQKIWTRLSNYGTMETAIANLMQEVVIGKYSISNLAAMLASNDKSGIQKIYNRIDIIQASKSVLNAVLLDASNGEKFERDALSFSGVPEIIDRMMMGLSAVARTPVTRLFGRSPAGMNATGEGDQKNYHDRISSRQTDEVLPVIKKIDSWLLPTINQSINPDELTYVFNPLDIPTAKEVAEVKKLESEAFRTRVEALRTLVELQIFDSEEIKDAEFKNYGEEVN